MEFHCYKTINLSDPKTVWFWKKITTILHFYILIANYKADFYQFWFKAHLEYEEYKMWTLWPYHPGALLAGPNKQNKAQIFKNVFFNPTKVWKARMHDYDVQEAIYQNCETHGSYVRSSRLDQYWHILKMYSILENFLYSYTCLKNPKAWLWCPRSPFP